MQIIIDTADTSITVKNKCFFIENKTISRQISPKRISSIAITTNCNLNSSAIKLAANHQVSILFFNNIGSIQARLWSPYFVNLAQLRKKQLLFSMSPKATAYILDLLSIKSNLQIYNLEQGAIAYPKAQKKIQAKIIAIRLILEKFPSIEKQKINLIRQTILGWEGSISRHYFETLNQLLPEDFRFQNRSRRPALDYFNAALNYCYGLTYNIVESGVLAKGLDPAIGLLHTDAHQKPTLVYDLIEPFRPIIDRMLIQLIQDQTLTSLHFIPKQSGFWMSKKGKRLIIMTFNDHLNTRILYQQKIRRLKDHIYQESNALGNWVESTIDLL